MSLIALAAASTWWLYERGGVPSPLPNGDELRSVPAELLVSSVVALTLIGVRRWDSAIASTLVFKPFRWLGTITFSLYLVHQFNLQLASRAAAAVLGAEKADTIAGYTLRVCVLVAIGTGFWFCCERPFLNKPLPAKA